MFSSSPWLPARMRAIDRTVSLQHQLLVGLTEATEPPSHPGHRPYTLGIHTSIQLSLVAGATLWGDSRYTTPRGYTTSFSYPHVGRYGPWSFSLRSGGRALRALRALEDGKGRQLASVRARHWHGSVCATYTPADCLDTDPPQHSTSVSGCVGSCCQRCGRFAGIPGLVVGALSKAKFGDEAPLLYDQYRGKRAVTHEKSEPDRRSKGGSSSRYRWGRGRRLVRNTMMGNQQVPPMLVSIPMRVAGGKCESLYSWR